jgi:hypothetical protein
MLYLVKIHPEPTVHLRLLVRRRLEAHRELFLPCLFWPEKYADSGAT